MLKAGLVYEGVYEETESSTPQGGIASPILGNIYLSELDEFIASKMSTYHRGQGAGHSFLVSLSDTRTML